MDTRLAAHPIIAFVLTSDPAKARAFYEGILGLRFIRQDHLAIVFEAHGNMLRVGVVDKVSPTNNTVLGWEVPDIAAAVKMLESLGVAFERRPDMKQDELGIW